MKVMYYWVIEIHNLFVVAITLGIYNVVKNSTNWRFQGQRHKCIGYCMLSYIVQYEKRSKLIRYLLPTHSYEVLVVEPHAPFRLVLLRLGFCSFKISEWTTSWQLCTALHGSARPPHSAGSLIFGWRKSWCSEKKTPRPRLESRGSCRASTHLNSLCSNRERFTRWLLRMMITFGWLPAFCIKSIAMFTKWSDDNSTELV